MVRSQHPATVAAQRSIRASFKAPYPFEDEISDDEIIDPTSNSEVLNLTRDDEGRVSAFLSVGKDSRLTCNRTQPRERTRRGSGGCPNPGRHELNRGCAEYDMRRAGRESSGGCPDPDRHGKRRL